MYAERESVPGSALRLFPLLGNVVIALFLKTVMSQWKAKTLALRIKQSLDISYRMMKSDQLQHGEEKDTPLASI